MDRPSVSVAVVGGGVTGLATAHFLEQAAKEEGWELKGTLVEKDERIGGKLLTSVEDGFVVEGGPDSFLTQKPWALEMAKELGMEPDLLSQASHGVFLLYQGKLHSVPRGLMGVVPTRAGDLWKASFLSWRGKLRASMEPFIRRRRNGGDESLAAFLRRRLGREVSERLVETFTASLYAGDAQQLGLRELFPALAQWEEQYGSLTRGLRAVQARPRPSSTSASPFISLRNGMASLPKAMANSLTDFKFVLGSRVTAIIHHREHDHPPFHLSLQGGDYIDADCVVLAIPASDSSVLLRPISPQTALLLGRLTFAPTASVTLAFRRDAVTHPLNGSGFLVPRVEPSLITACTWSSSKWSGRVPQGWVLLRAFLGWSGDNSFLNQDDLTVVRLATDVLRPILGLRGAAERSWVHRWPQAMPQYKIGHLTWLKELQQTLTDLPGVFLAGASYQGVGIPDCIRQGKEASQRVRQLLSQRIVHLREGTQTIKGSALP
ncbi:MAG: protoporphyrinogen oxidase [Chloroflexi bacterium]|nr:protoporphyrinogen oxidase [Chloroflexota bacterium]